jgi:hypothetical protein
MLMFIGYLFLREIMIKTTTTHNKFTMSKVAMPMTTRSAKPERAKEDWHGYLVEQRETLGVL